MRYDKKAKAYYKKLHISDISDFLSLPPGCPNESVDAAKKEYDTWSDTNLDKVYPTNESIIYLICSQCFSTTFEVAQTGSYQTSARCVECGFWYKVHCG